VTGHLIFGLFITFDCAIAFVEWEQVLVEGPRQRREVSLDVSNGVAVVVLNVLVSKLGTEMGPLNLQVHLLRAVFNLFL